MKKSSRVLLLVSAIILLSAFLLGIYLYNKPKKNIRKANPDYILHSDILTQEFLHDALLAEKKYNGKIVQLTGKLADVIVKPGVILVLDDPMTGIQCSMDTIFLPANEAARLIPGQLVTVKGECDGFTDFGVVLEPAYLLKNR